MEQQSYLYSSQNNPVVPQTLRTPPTTYYYYDPIATPVNVRQRRQRQFVNTDKSSVVVLQNPVQNGRQSINFEQTAKVQIKELPPLIRTRQSPPSRFFAQGMYNLFDEKNRRFSQVPAIHNEIDGSFQLHRILTTD